MSDERSESAPRREPSVRLLRAPGASPISGVVPPIEHRFKPGNTVGHQGGPKLKPIRDAYKKYGAMTAEDREKLDPSKLTAFELMAIAMLRKGSSPGTGMGSVAAAIEVTNRVEGSVAQNLNVTSRISDLAEAELETEISELQKKIS